MIAVVDYGIGNLFSLLSSLKAVGADAVLTGEAAVLRSADKIILPGVGAFRDAVQKLNDTGLKSVVCEEAKKGKHFLGICLGMQLLFEKSYENGCYDGLGLIPGVVMPLKDKVGMLKIPQIGWNALSFPKGKEKGKLYAQTPEGAFVYFVHSYYAAECEAYVSATAEYGIPVTASVENGNVYGTQYHPEKSGKAGLAILKAFCDL